MLRVSGNIPAGQVVTRFVSVFDATRHFLTILREVLQSCGIPVAGGIAGALEDGAPGATGAPLVEHASPPLREIAAVAMRTSHNLPAESLFRALARAGTPPGTVDAARDAVAGVLHRWGVPEDSVVVADGSGLSRYNHLTASALMIVLRRMAGDQRHCDEWLSLFPVGGRQGTTLASRFTGGAASGRVRAKTGTLGSVRALSGYVRTLDGELLAFVMIVNNAVGSRSDVQDVLDRAVERLVRFER